MKAILGSRDFWVDAHVAYREVAGIEYTILWPKDVTGFKLRNEGASQSHSLLDFDRRSFYLGDERRFGAQVEIAGVGRSDWADFAFASTCPILKMVNDGGFLYTLAADILFRNESNY